MKRLLIFIYTFLFIFSSVSSVPVYASEISETSEDSDIVTDVVFTLFDAVQALNALSGGDGSIDNPRLYDAAQSLVEMSGNVVESGKIAADVLNSCINKSVSSVASSFLACGQDMIADSIELMRQSDDLMRSIWFYPSRGLFEWDSDTYKAGHDILVDKFTNLETSVAEGFYPCNLYNQPVSFYARGNGRYNSVFTSAQSYFTAIDSSHIVICSFLTANNNNNITWSWRYTSTPDVLSSWEYGSGNTSFNISYIYNGVNYWYQYASGSDDWGAIIGPYRDRESAARAFYSHVAESKPVPNGKGFFRPLPDGKKMTATAKNVFNTDFNLYITNNYNTYGDTFNTVPIDTYPYTKLDPDTPSWWYDIYTPAIDIPHDDLSDLNNIDLTPPDLSINTTFITSCFAAIPDQLALLFVSLSILGAAMFIFKKG